MARRRTSTHIWTLWVAFGVSCTLHVLLFVEVVRLIDDPDPVDAEPPEPTSTPPKKLEVTMTREPPESVEEPPEKDEQKETREEPEKEEKKEEKNKELVRDVDRKAVVQETNEENPDQADFVSSQANRVEKETRARQTKAEFTPESDSSPDKKEGAKKATEETKLGSKKAVPRERPPEAAPKPKSRKPPEPTKREPEPKPKERPTDAPRPTENKKAPDAPKPTESEKPNPAERPDEPLPLPSADDISRIFDQKKDREKVREHAQKGPGHEMYKRIENDKGAVKSAMKNYITEVEPGNHTAVNAEADVAATYINRIHSKIHPRWGGEFLPYLDTNYGPNSPLSDSSLNTVLEFVVDGETGKLEKVNIVESSGLTTYDMEAINISKNVAPHPRAPSALRSPDGNVYLHWNFWRDQRQCGTFGVSIYKLTEDGSKQKAGEGNRGMRE